MKKNTVITIVIAVLLCLVLLGMNPLSVNADGEQEQWTSYSGKYMEHPVRVTFINEESTPITLLIEKDNTFAELPPLQEGWKWCIDGTETEFTTSTVVSDPLTVKAIRIVNNYDFLGTASGILVGTNEHHNNQMPTAVTTAKHGNDGLEACFEDENCEPPVWTFTYDENLGCPNETECYYTVSSAGGYLNIEPGKISTGDAQSILVKKLDSVTYVLYHVNGEGKKDSALSIKLNEGFRDNQGNPNHNNFWIGPSARSEYYNYPTAPKSSGLRFHFYNGEGFQGKTYTFNFEANGGNETRPLSVSTKENIITMPSYNGVRNGHTFLGWSGDPNYEDEMTLYQQSVSYNINKIVSDLSVDSTPKNITITLYAVYDSDPILWFDAQGGTVTNPAFYKGDIPEGTLYPETSRDGGFKLEGWEDPALPGVYHQPNDPLDPIVMPEEGDKTFIAIWSPLVRVSFNAGKTDVIVTPSLIDDKKAGEEIDLTTITLTPDLSSKLIGWSDGGHIYSKDSKYIVPEKRDVVMTAIWKEDGNTLTFDVNGGESETKIPPMTDLTLGQVITLPDYDGTKKVNNIEYKFIGWSDSADIMKGNNANFKDSRQYFHRVFKPGDSYLITKQQDITLYAVWSKTEPDTIKVKFGIRMDGKIPPEPGSYNKNDYTSRFETTTGNYTDFYSVTDKQWIIDVDSLNQWDIPSDPKIYYQDNKITQFLGAKNLPSLDVVKNMVASTQVVSNNKPMETFDSAKHFVYWYVLKYQGKSENNVQLWHVDGVVVHKRPWVRVVYDLGEISGLVNITEYPLGYQVDMTDRESQLITVGAENETETVKTKTPKASGYKFVGWKVKGEGDDIFMNGYRYPLPNDRDVTFIAQWQPEAYAENNLVSSQVTVKWDGEVIPSAVKVKLIQVFSDNIKNTVDTFTITSADNWMKFVGNLPAKDRAGNPIKYEWEETAMVFVSGENTGEIEPDYMYNVTTGHYNSAASFRTIITNVRKDQLEVTITADSVTADKNYIYNGTPLTKNSYTNTDLAEGDSIASVTVKGSQTDAGSSDNVPSGALIKRGNVDVTVNYKIKYVNGTLTVNQRPLTITAGSVGVEPGPLVYYGEEASTESYSYDPSELVAGDHVESVKVSGSQKNAGDGENEAKNAVIKNASDKDVTANYAITYIKGKLRVTAKPLTITAKSDSKEYDGNPLENDGYTFDQRDLAYDDHIESVTVTGSQTFAGSSDNVPSDARIVNASGEDVTANYEFDYKNGTLTVAQKPLTITAQGDTKVYDGTPLTKNSYTNTDLAEGDSIASVTVTGSQTLFGNSENSLSDIKIENGKKKDVTESYNITIGKGTLEVTKKPLTITADSDTKVYDGTPLTKNSYTNTALAEGDHIESVTVTGSQTIDGSSDNVPSDAVIRNADGKDVTNSYQITYVNGKLQVSGGNALIIKAVDDTKVYDGTALVNTGYTYTDLNDGDHIESVTVTGSQTFAGTSKNVPSDAKIVNAAGEDVTKNYTITFENGTLEVTKKPLYIEADSAAKTYDGKELKKESYTTSELAAGDSISFVKFSGARTQAGRTPNIPSDAVIVNKDGDIVTDNYAISYTRGILLIAKKPVKVIADNLTKEYGQSDPVFTAKAEGVLDFDRIDYQLNREPGETPGEYVITPSYTNLPDDNYEVIFETGTLTINKNPDDYTIEKVWNDDNNRDGLRPVNIRVNLVGSDGVVYSRNLSAENNWTVTLTDLPRYNGVTPINYTWTEESVEGYTSAQTVSSNVTTSTGTHEIARTTSSVNVIWDDKDNKIGTRPTSLTVVLRGNDRSVLRAVVNADTGWSTSVANLPLNENGAPINYVWYEQSLGGNYYAVSSTTSNRNTTLVNSNLYKLTIHYRYNDGSQAVQDYVDTLAAGETFVIESPAVSGFVATPVSSVGIMPAAPAEIIVVYAAAGQEAVRQPVERTPEEETVIIQKEVPQPREQLVPDDEHTIVLMVPTRMIDIEEYGTALGLGDVHMTTGGTFSFE